MPDNLNSPSLLQTKLNRPAITRDYVTRQRLLALLNERRDRPLVLVSAAAGFGKSTLLSAWLETCDWPGAWLSLDESDSDLVTFLSYFLTAIQTLFTEAVQETWSLLSAATLPPIPVLARSLINELEDIDQPFILVLDDYHVIHGSAVHKLLEELLRYPPRSMRLALAARFDPPLSITVLRARDKVTEIRSPELRFSLDEVSAFLQQVVRAKVDLRTAAAVEDKTEGWAAGLRLTALSMRDTGVSSSNGSGALPDGRPAIADDHFAIDFLVGEVLSKQPPAIQEFLVKTSILDRLSGPLCDAVVEPKTGGDEPADHPARDGQARLEQLETLNLLLIRLDDRSEWYRYHHLFQAALQRQLKIRFSRDEISDLHRRAGAWLAQSNLVEEALQHLIAAGDHLSAVRLFARHRHALLNGEQWHRLRQQISLFPRPVIEAQPELLLTECWIARSNARVQDIPARLDRAEALIARMASDPAKSTASVSLQGESDCLRTFQYYWASDVSRTLFYGQRALETTPRDWWGARLIARLLLAGAYQNMGDKKSAYAVMYDGMAEGSHQDSHFQSRLLVSASFVHLVFVDLDGLMQVSSQALALSEKLDQPETMYWAHYMMGAVHYYRNELSAAEGHFTTVLSQRYLANAQCAIQSVFALALVYQAQGQPDKARGMADLAVSFALELSHSFLLSAARVFQAELAVRQGRVADADRWLEQFPPDKSTPTLFFSGQWMTPAKALLASDTAEGRHAAAEKLSLLRDAAEAKHDLRAMIEVLALQSLLHDVQGEHAAALAALERAVKLAQPSGIIRIFADLGPQIGDLLRRLRSRGVAPDYIQEILAAIGPAKPATTAMDQDGLMEPLTDRELDVLRLLEERFSDKEIAEHLIISPGTVKRHTHTIYAKLCVSGRREAVAKAESLGILLRSRGDGTRGD